MAAGLGVHALGGEEILDAQRNAFQCAALTFGKFGIGSFGHVARLIGRGHDIGIEQFGLFDCREIGVSQFQRRKFPGAQLGAGFGNGERGERHYSTTFGTMKKSSSDCVLATMALA